MAGKRQTSGADIDIIKIAVYVEISMSRGGEATGNEQILACHREIVGCVFPEIFLLF